MIPTLSLSKVGPSVSGGKTPRPGNATVEKESSASGHPPATQQPVPPRVSSSFPSPRVATAGTATTSTAAQWTKRSTELVPIIGVDVMQCQDVATLQQRLVELGERYVKLDAYYDSQLQEKTVLFQHRLQQVIGAEGSEAFSPSRSAVVRSEPSVVPGRPQRPASGSLSETVPAVVHTSPNKRVFSAGSPRRDLAQTLPASSAPSPRRDWMNTSLGESTEELGRSAGRVERHSSQKTPVTRLTPTSHRRRSGQ
ncbi:hypothetical protein ADEAN_000760000 [Angomonas deanei]|uniref:Uncharacterized protein n=1 Tax=Angomonas deanei TaxID=59799 RepID=A0A7G2CJV9_9TRYP|nr:hypothetical protein ADEAN_000760000 [Angomonas deanei]